MRMLKTIYLTNDDKVSHPEESVNPEPDICTRLTIGILKPAKAKTGSFLQTARSLKPEGPCEWSTNLDDCLYENKSRMGAK